MSQHDKTQSCGACPFAGLPRVVLVLGIHAIVLGMLFSVELPWARAYNRLRQATRKFATIEFQRVTGAPRTRVVLTASTNGQNSFTRDFAVNQGEIFEYQLAQRPADATTGKRLRRCVDNDFWIFFEQLGLVWYGILACLFIWVYDPAKRKHILVFVFVSLITGFLVEALKNTIGKIRPAPYFNIASPYLNVRWLGVLKGWTTSAPLAFPSGHATQAFVTATFLALSYPRVRYTLYTVAVLTALSRVLTEAHWLSDIYAGMLLGYYATWGATRLSERLDDAGYLRRVEGLLQRIP